MSLEYTFDNSTAAYLRGLGHNITYIEPGQSTAQAIKVLDNGTIEAAGEPRLSNSAGLAY